MKTKRWNVGIIRAVVLWMIGLATAHAGSTFYVSVTGNDVSGNGSQGTPWASVTNAVAKAAADDTIRVGGGVYTQNVTMAKANLSIQGGYNPVGWAWDPANQTTTIFGNGNSSVTVSGANMTETLSYLTLSGGTGGSQAGVLMTAAADGNTLVVEGCKIIGNRYGVYRLNGVIGSHLVFRNTLIADNTANGIYANILNDQNVGSCKLINCTIANNRSHGYFSNSGSGGNNMTPSMTNTLVTGNNGYGIYLPYSTGNGAAGYSLFYGNTNGAWFGYVTDLGGNKFCQAPLYVDESTGDYRLQSTSPAVAAGVDLSASGLNNDIVNVARPGINGWDMGVYQGSGTGAPTPVTVGYVSMLGSDNNDGTSAHPWRSVSYGVGRLASTGTLYVAGGVYTNNLWLGAGKMTIQGGYDATDWSWNPAQQRTVINGNVTAPPVAILSTTSTNTLSCLTLCGATASETAGIEVRANNSVLTAEGCTISNNFYGVKVNAVASTVTVRNSLIARNSLHGIYVGTRDGIRMPWPGGGTLSLQNCTIANNGGHGYHCYLSANDGHTPPKPYVTNCLFTANGGYGIFAPGLGSSGNVGYSLFNGNALGPWYGAFRPFTDVGHNKVEEDPRYVDAANNDYRLQSSSSAAAAGANLSTSLNKDIVNTARPGTYGWDMGAYQGNGTGAPPAVAVGYVATTGSDANSGTPSSPWASITYGVGRLNATGTLYVAGGVYTNNVVFYEGTKTILGGYNSTDWTYNPAEQSTVIFGNTVPPVMILAANSTNTLRNLTLSGGTKSDAAGIRVFQACSLVVDACTITGNTYGVTSDNFNLQALFRNTVIARNTSHGIYAPTYYLGGGLCSLYNCTLANNGGSGFYTASKPTTERPLPVVATNTLFTSNGGYGLCLIGNGNARAAYSLFYGNTSGAWVATNSASVDMFINGGNNFTTQAPQYVDAASGNYRINADSPAYNSGTDLTFAGVTEDLVGTLRPRYGTFDRGAYEFWVIPPKATVIVIK